MWAGDDIEQGVEVDTLTAYKIVRERFISPHKWMH